MPLSTDFLTNPQQFCQRWICIMPGLSSEGAKLPSPLPPANNPDGTLAADGTPWRNTGDFFNNRAPGEHDHKMGYNIAAAAAQVCWRQLDNDRVKLYIQGSFDANAINTLGDWFPAYFLPWGPGQIGRMELPSQPTATVAAPVRAFFTAEMNGCSFLAAGNPQSPLVSHYNVSQGNANLTQAQKDQIQAAMVKALMRAKRGGANLGNLSVGVIRKAATAGAGDALTGTRIADAGATPYGLTPAEVLALEQAVDTELTNRNMKDPAPPILDIRLATMGTLDAGTRAWSFFYQRNVMAYSQAIDRLGRMGGIIKKLGQDNRAIQPLQRYLRVPGWEHTALWPGGAGHVNIPAHGDPDQA